MSQIFRDDSEKYHDYGFHLQKRLVRLMGEITEESAAEFIMNLNMLDNGPGGGDIKKAQPIIIDISTPGGSTVHGWAIYDRIRNSSAYVTGRIWGEASSAGSFILQACSERQMSESSVILLHEGSYDSGDDHNRNQEEAAKQIQVYRKKMIQVFANAMCRNESYIEKMLIIDRHFYAEEALRVGLVDKVLENDPPEWYTDEYKKEIRRRVNRDRRKK